MAIAIGGVAAGPAHASNVTLHDHVLRYSAAGNEVNDVELAFDSPTQVTVTDSAAPLHTDPSCQQLDDHRAVCRSAPPVLMRVAAGGGNDSVSITGNAPAARVSGGPGDDRLTGSAADDWLSGGPGNDSVFGGAGEDSIAGGSGRDLLLGGDGFDQIDARDGARHDDPDVVACGLNGDDVDGRRPPHARARDADLFTTDCEQLDLGLPSTAVTLRGHPLTTEAFALSFSCPRRTFRLGCASDVLLTSGEQVLASGRRRLQNGRETLTQIPLTDAGRAVANGSATVTALARVRYRAGHAKGTATFRLLVPPATQ